MTPEEIVEFAEALGRVAASGGGAKAIATLLAERSGAAVLVEDAQWRPLATAGKGALPPTARGLSAERARTIPLATGETGFGFLSLVGDARTPYDAMLPALRLAATTLAVELARDRSAGPNRKRRFWDRLLERGYPDVGSAREDAMASGVALASHYLCVALEADVESAEDDRAAELRALAAETFRAGDGELALIERGAALVAVVPASREVDAENARTAAHLLPKSAAKRNLQMRVSGGISSVVPVLDIGRASDAAQAALAIVRRIYGGGRVASYDELGAYPLLYSGADGEQLRAFASRALAPLRAYDDKHQTELERTLRVYFFTGQNVKTTAAELNVHRHTVFYRLRQIADISGRSLESAHDQLTLRLAIAVDALYT